MTHKNVIICIHGCSWDKAVSVMCGSVAISWQIQVRQLPGSIHLSLNAHICTKWYIWGWFCHPDVGDFNSSFIYPVSDSQAPLTFQNTVLRAVLLTLAATTKNYCRRFLVHLMTNWEERCCQKERCCFSDGAQAAHSPLWHCGEVLERSKSWSCLLTGVEGAESCKAWSVCVHCSCRPAA